jgi:4a-hydroxytetrahydrobiopterin dehydratase
MTVLEQTRGASRGRRKMSASRRILSVEELGNRMVQAPGWKIVDGKKLARTFRFPDFQKGLDFVNRVGAIAEKQGHHPDIQLSWGSVQVETWTHDAGGLTEQDILLASQISQLD